MQPELDINHTVTTILLKRIIELLDTKDEPPETLQADEVRAALRNELATVVRSIKDLPDNKDIIKELKNLTTSINKIQFNPSINVEAAQVTVPDVVVPKIELPEIHVPEIRYSPPDISYNPPDINIEPPTVNVAAPVVNVEPTDLSSIIKALETNLNKLRTNSVGRPLAVRLSDGQEWIKELRAITERQATAVQYMSDVSYLKSIDGGRINPATSDNQTLGMLIPFNYDSITLSPPSLPTTITGRQGGLTGTTVAVLTIVYDGTDISTVTRVIGAPSFNYLLDPDGNILYDPDGNPLFAGD